jgi:acyl carrier protein
VNTSQPAGPAGTDVSPDVSPAIDAGVSADASTGVSADLSADAGTDVGTDVRADQASVHADIAGMLRTLLDEYGLEDVEIGMDTSFTRDLELESIDLVTLAGLLEARYGRRVNFAEFIADMELDEIIALTVGRLVTHVVECLATAEVS